MASEVRYLKQMGEVGNEMWVGYEDGSYQLFQVKERNWNKNGSCSSVVWYPTDKIYNKKDGE